jgi:uncharacterized protein YbbC (DUF1343 family)
VQLHIVARTRLASLKTGVALLQTIHDLYPDRLVFTPAAEGRHPFFDLLAGSAKLRGAIAEGHGPEYAAEEEARDLTEFSRSVAEDLLY